MNTSKFLTGTLAGTVVGLALGFLIFGLALSGYMQENASANEEPNMIWLIIGHLAFAALITYIFLQWANIRTAGTGAKAGATIALLAALAFNFIYLGTTDLFPGGPVAATVDALGATVVWAIGGAVIGWVLGRGES